MWGTKLKTLLLAFALLLAAGCAGQTAEIVDMSTRLADSGIAEKKTTYQVVEVKPQDLIRTMNLSVEASYRLIRPVRTGSSELVLKEILVERNDRVEAGQPVAILQGLGSPADVEQKELEIKAQQANMEERLAWYEEQLEAILDRSAWTRVRKDIRAKQAEICETERDLYILQAQSTLDNLEKSLEQLRAAAGEIVLYAPVTGLVRSVNSRYKAGETIPAGTEMCTIYGEDSLLLVGSSSSGCFVYGREVTVTLGRGDKVRSYPGTVVSSPEVVPLRYRGNSIYIRVDPSILSGKSVQGGATVDCLILRDALVIPKTAVTSEEGIYYVQVLDGDTPRKRPILRGPSIGTQVAVLQGLQEGDLVVVSSYNS
jgi:HlyD family secretion protein